MPWMHTGGTEVSWIIVAAVPYNIRLFTSEHISSWVSISNTISQNNSNAKEGGAGGFRGVSASTTTCTLLKFISMFRTRSKVRLTWKCHIIYAR
jgi:hypothetical protein